MRNAKMIFCVVLVSASVPFLAVRATAETSESGVNQSTTRLAIQIGNKKFTAVIYDNDSAAAFLRKIPMTIDMRELNGNEKYFYLSGRLPASSQRIGAINNGDLMLYGSDCIVLFYQSFLSSYSYTKLGYITDATGLASALGNDSVKVSFSVVK